MSNHEYEDSNGNEFEMRCGCEDCADFEINKIISEAFMKAAEIQSEEELVDLFLGIAKQSEQVGIMRHIHHLEQNELDTPFEDAEEEAEFIAEELVDVMKYFENSNTEYEKTVVKSDVQNIVEAMLSTEDPEEMEKLEEQGYVRHLTIDEDENGLSFNMWLKKED